MRLVTLAALLTALGLVAVYSASGVRYATDGRIGDHAFLLRRQAMYACAGWLALLACSSVRPEQWMRLRWPLWVGAVGMLGLVFVPGVGVELNQAHRWIRAGPYTIQASEFARLALIVALAGFLGRDPERVRQSMAGLVALLAALFVPVGLIAMEPDVGTAALTTTVGCAMIFVAGAPLLPLALLAGGAMAAGGVVTTQRFAHVVPRLEEWGTAYQVRQAIIAVGSGGLFGEGLGRGLQKLLYVPEAPSDFIFAVWAEEMGWAGSMALLLLYGALLGAGWGVARRAATHFGRLVALGLTASITLGALTNLMVVTGLLPAKGLPLPFVSAGGSSLVATLAAVGILISVAGHTDETGDRGRRDGRAPDGGDRAGAAPGAARS